jgi:flagellar FliL protein
MAEEATDLDAEILPEDLAAGLKKKKFSGKQLVLFIVLPLLLAVGLGVGAYFMFFAKHAEKVAAEEKANANKTEVLFYDLPEMLVNLNAGGRKANYLKIHVALEVDKQSTMALLEEKQARIIDNFQVYLRELRVEDLNGSAGMFRLKEELLQRVNVSIAPAQVKDVLFKEMLVQ